MSIELKEHDQESYKELRENKKRQKELSLNEKIEIFNRFTKTGKKLTGKTIF